MGTRLRPEDVVTIVVLQERGTPKRAIARTLGVTEGAVRYQDDRPIEVVVAGAVHRFEGDPPRVLVGAVMYQLARIEGRDCLVPLPAAG